MDSSLTAKNWLSINLPRAGTKTFRQTVSTYVWNKHTISIYTVTTISCPDAASLKQFFTVLFTSFAQDAITIVQLKIYRIGQPILSSKNSQSIRIVENRCPIKLHIPIFWEGNTRKIKQLHMVYAAQISLPRYPRRDLTSWNLLEVPHNRLTKYMPLSRSFKETAERSDIIKNFNDVGVS